MRYTVLAFVCAVEIAGAYGVCSTAGSGATLLSSPEARRIESRLDIQNRRMAAEFTLLQKLLEKPKPKSFWEENWQFFAGTILVGLILAPAVSFLYSKAQRRYDLTMDLLKQWISDFATVQTPGIQNLRVYRLTMSQAQLNAVVQLGNFYEIVATAMRFGHVNPRLFEQYGIKAVMCEFRSVAWDVARSATPASPTNERAVSDRLDDLLSNWDNMGRLCAS